LPGLNGKWRVIGCRDGIHWILQGQSGGTWRNCKFCVTRAVLLRDIGMAGEIDETAMAIIEALPGRYSELAPRVARRLGRSKKGLLPEMRARDREARRWRYGMPGGPRNPLGARALYLFKGTRDTLFRIHGTREPKPIGKAVSSGCIRMLNADVSELYEVLPLGTKVVVLASRATLAQARPRAKPAPPLSGYVIEYLRQAPCAVLATRGTSALSRKQADLIADGNISIREASSGCSSWRNAGNPKP
jgi:hypothetical protein